MFQLYLFLTTILWYRQGRGFLNYFFNSYTIEFTFLNYAIQYYFILLFFFSIFTELGKDHNHLIPETFHLSKKKLHIH